MRKRSLRAYNLEVSWIMSFSGALFQNVGFSVFLVVSIFLCVSTNTDLHLSLIVTSYISIRFILFHSKINGDRRILIVSTARSSPLVIEHVLLPLQIRILIAHARACPRLGYRQAKPTWGRNFLNSAQFVGLD